MSNTLLDDVEKTMPLVVVKPHHSKSRLILLFYTVFIFLSLIFSSEYTNAKNFDVVNFGSKILVIGFVIYCNYKQLVFEKTNEKSHSALEKIETLVFFLFLIFMLIFSGEQLVNILSKNWYSLPSLAHFCIIVAILSVMSLEFQYLRQKFKA